MDDDTLVRVWLHGRPASTRRAYGMVVGRLRRALACKPLAQAALEDLQIFAGGMASLAPRSQARAVAAIRSLYAFHVDIGTLAANPAAALAAPSVPQDLAQRILTEAEVERLIAAAPAGWRRTALRSLYIAGLRAAELCALRWRQLVARAEGGQVTVHGKGGKTRAVVLPAALWAEIVDLKGNAAAGAPVFPSPRDPARPISYATLWRTVRAAAQAAGLSERASAHWLRHSHGSHALDNGASLTLVRDTLGHASVATTDKYLHARPGESSANYLGSNPSARPRRPN